MAGLDLLPALIDLGAVLLLALGIKGLSKVSTARSANGLAALAMGLAVLGLLIQQPLSPQAWLWVAIGTGLGGVLGLIDGVLDGFQPDATLFGERVGQVGAVADGVDVRIIGLGEGVHAYAVVHFKAGFGCELGVGQDAHADQDDVRWHDAGRCGHGKGVAGAVDGFGAHITAQVHAGLAMFILEEFRDLRRGGPGKNARHCLEDRHFQPPLHGDGGNLEADVAGADDDQLDAGLHAGAQRVDVIDAAQVVACCIVRTRQGQLAHARAGGQDELGP